jgi:predicted site-specific integrase-resolvase
VKLQTRKEAAEFLRISPRTLEKWAVTGQGPPFAKIGARTLYSDTDLEAWVNSRKRHNTSEYSELEAKI